MIIASPVGGLANQMSVYAAAKALAMHHNVDLRLDKIGLASDSKRVFELDKLNTDIKFASAQDIRNVIGPSQGVGHWLRRKLRKKGFLLGLYKERVLSFDENFFDLPANIYLKGNFHSIHYYEPIKNTLREEFTINRPLSEESATWQEKIRSTNSVALHIRRGDYAIEPKTRKFHGLLGLSYYQKAIAIIENKVHNPELFVFSDDHAWVRQNLKTQLKTHYVDCNDASQGYQDFHLMCQCRHYIIANSGFSRWAAWLNSDENKIVCMPARWLAHKEIPDWDNAPMNWIRVENSFL